MKKTQVTDKNTQKPRRHQKNPDLVEKNPAVATLHVTEVDEEMGRNLYSKSIKNWYNIFTKSFFSCSP